jgi:hypothetical protein
MILLIILQLNAAKAPTLDAGNALAHVCSRCVGEKRPEFQGSSDNWIIIRLD